MVKIIKRNNVIPVDFGEFQLEFIVNDANIKLLDKASKHIPAKEHEIMSAGENQIDKFKELIAETYDMLFGKGTFKKVYDFANGSTMETFLCLLDVLKGITDDYQERYNENNLKKYLSK